MPEQEIRKIAQAYSMVLAEQGIYDLELISAKALLQAAIRVYQMSKGNKESVVIEPYRGFMADVIGPQNYPRAYGRIRYLLKQMMPDEAWEGATKALQAFSKEVFLKMVEHQQKIA